VLKRKKGLEKQSEQEYNLVLVMQRKRRFMELENYIFLVSIAIILLTTKILGDVTNKVNMTQVVGALLAGVLIGPSCFNWVNETDFVNKTAEIGVIFLMFMAGLDTDVKQLKKNSVACVVIASLGVLLPLIGGTLAYYCYFEQGATDYEEILKAVFIGVGGCRINGK